MNIAGLLCGMAVRTRTRLPLHARAEREVGVLTIIKGHEGIIVTEKCPGDFLLSVGIFRKLIMPDGISVLLEE